MQSLADIEKLPGGTVITLDGVEYIKLKDNDDFYLENCMVEVKTGIIVFAFTLYE